jgi:hypothetical protein
MKRAGVLEIDSYILNLDIKRFKLPPRKECLTSSVKKVWWLTEQIQTWWWTEKSLPLPSHCIKWPILKDKTFHHCNPLWNQITTSNLPELNLSTNCVMDVCDAKSQVLQYTYLFLVLRTISCRACKIKLCITIQRQTYYSIHNVREIWNKYFIILHTSWNARYWLPICSVLYHTGPTVFRSHQYQTQTIFPTKRMDDIIFYYKQPQCLIYTTIENY